MMIAPRRHLDAARAFHPDADGKAAGRASRRHGNPFPDRVDLELCLPKRAAADEARHV